MRNNPTTFMQALNEHFEPAILYRGKAIYQSGRVMWNIQQSKTAQGIYSASIKGDSGKTYRTEIYWDKRNSFMCNCNCPYEYNCKHAAALGFYIAHTFNINQATADDGIEDWLTQLNKLLPPAIPKNTSAKENGYALSFDEGIISLHAISRTLKKDGSYSKVPKRTRLFSSGSSYHDKAIEFLTDNPYNGQTLIENEIGHLLLKHALATGNLIHFDDEQPITQGAPQALFIEWHDDHNISCSMRIADLVGATLLPVNPPMYYLDHKIGLLDTELSFEEIGLLATMPPLPKEKAKTVLHQVRQHINKPALVLPAIATITPLNTPHFTAVFTSTPFHMLPALALQVSYGPFTYSVGNELPHALRQPYLAEHNQADYEITRNPIQEANAYEQLDALELLLYPYTQDLKLWVPRDFSPLAHLTAWQKKYKDIEQCIKEQGWELTIDANYAITEHTATLDAQFTDADNGWFTMALQLTVDGHEHSTHTILKQWLQQNCPAQLAVPTDNGWQLIEMGALSHLTGTLNELYNRDDSDKPINLPPFKANIANLFDNADTRQAPNLKKLKDSLSNFKGLKAVPTPKTLKAELRDYQQQGLAWLHFLYSYQLGGILADDMGLGKTLQTLAFIQKLKSGRKLDRGVLVVAPTTLLWNWLAEAQKFTPNLRVLILHGSERAQLFDDIPLYDLVLTSYPLLQRDIATLAKHTFNLVILDEAQAIKNKTAKTTQAAHLINADLRLCLTGTPLENHLGELWSIMNFALPGLLNNSDFFNQQYRTPIERDGNSQRSVELAQRIAPFMLRRTKNEVVKELPSKSEMVQYVHLEKDQRKLYEGIRVSMEKRVRELLKEKGVKRSHIEFLDALLKLRQACIDPSLVKLEQAKTVKSSAKMDWLNDNVPEMIEEGRRILIFSQFVTMLSTIAQHFDRQKIPYLKLTGQSKNRGELVEQFQQGQTPVFLISLKAGGAGLNLTAADTVIHVDPWWNPAVENQATDRAYRIGQDKPVFVYKLVAEGTVEEKIQAMQAQKQALADALFDGTSNAKLPTTGDELLALLS